jgi:hypothetical protein
MPHLHLPAEHSDADLVLATTLAEVVGSEDLYVAWTHDAGGGAIPEIDALVRERRAAGGPLAELFAALRAGALTLWRGIVEGSSASSRTPIPPTVHGLPHTAEPSS